MVAFFTPPPFMMADRDPNFANVSMLLHMDGANGSTSIIDSSNNGLAITAVGDAKLATTDKLFGTASLSLDGTTDRITTAASAALNFGTADFTVEFAVKSTKTSRVDIISQNGDFSAANWWGLLLNVSASGQISYYQNSTAAINVTATGWNNGTWRRLALSRAGGTMRLFLDGALLGSAASSFAAGNASSGLVIGSLYDGSSSLLGSLDELRITKGVGRYTAAYTPSIKPFQNS